MFGTDLAVFDQVGGLDESGEGDRGCVELDACGFEAAAKLAEEQVGDAAGAPGGASASSSALARWSSCRAASSMTG